MYNNPKCKQKCRYVLIKNYRRYDEDKIFLRNTKIVIAPFEFHQYNKIGLLDRMRMLMVQESEYSLL